MAFLKLLLKLLLLLAGAYWINSKYEVELLSAFSLLFGIFLFVQLLNSIGKVMPFFELTFGGFGIQLLIAPFLDYYYFKSEIFGIMLVDEHTYFSFVTYAILALYLGFHLVPKKENEAQAKLSFEKNNRIFEYIGERLIWIGYAFFLLSFFMPNFIVTTFAFIRFIGTIYLWFSKSEKRRFYMVLVWVPFVLLTIKGAVFINLIIWGALLYCLFMLTKKPNKLILTSLIIVSFFFIVILQTVKHQYREVAWDKKSTEEVSLIDLMIKQSKNIDAETFKLMGAGLNLRVSQGWIISHGLHNLKPNQHQFETSYLQKELLGILLPRFLYPDKVAVGSHEKFDLFTGWHLADGVAMNLGIIGDAYFNFGLYKGIIACLILGLIFGLMHRYYLHKLIVYTDLLAWSLLFYFMIMRAGNEFYSIMNWYVKTGIITFLFFVYVRPILIRQFNARSKRESKEELIEV